MFDNGNQSDLPIIAVGASAGQIGACRSLFQDMPNDIPAAFILVLNDMAGTEKIIEELARDIRLKVVQATEGMELRPGVVHVVPPDVLPTVAQGFIRLVAPEAGKGLLLPLDALLWSMAKTSVPVACIVLAGSGTDGSRGIRDLAEAGGTVIVQNPDEAGVREMPDAVIATGQVTEVLPVAQMQAALQAFLWRRILEQVVVENGIVIAVARSANETLQSDKADLATAMADMQARNEALTAQATELRNVLASLDIGMLYLDQNLCIRFFTPAARSIFRVIPSDVGRPLVDLATGARDDHLRGDAIEVLRTLAPVEREISRTDGQWYQRRIQPYRREDGQVDGVVVTYTDITERKRATAALETARAKAEASNTAKSEFLAAASHDLRQPMQSMALLQKLIAEPSEPQESTRLVKLMDQTLRSMSTMLDSILDANRIDTGAVEPQMQPVLIGPLMQRLAEEFQQQCVARNIRLRVVSTSASVRSDPQLLEQILRNLMSNALRYTPKGSILMGCRRRGNKLTMIVCDTGIGVTAAERAIILEPYQRGHKPIETAETGLGLGLSIVARLAQLMDHPITVKSTPGRGSAFTLELDVVEAAPETPTPKTEVPTNQPGVIRTGTILLVEDEEPLRDLLAQVLERAGHTVVAKFDAEDAMRWATGESVRPDLLLANYDLRAGTTGLQLAQDLPDVLEGALPTIILTGDVSSDTLAEITDAGFQTLVKPVQPDTLLAQISEMLQPARAEKPNDPHGSDIAAITVHVVDDDAMIRESMRRVFQAEGWGVETYSSAEDFLAQPRPTGTACLLVSQALPGLDGVGLMSALRHENAALPAVMLTSHADAALAVAAMRAGAFDMIEKPSSAAELVASVRLAIKGGAADSGQSTEVLDAKRRLAGLTDREHEVLVRVLEGAPNKIIAADLGINQRTVEHHRASVMRKTGANSVPALVRLAYTADYGNA